MLTEIAKMWQLIAVSKDSVLELRALWPKGIGENRGPVFRHFIAANYESKSKLKDAFETAASNSVTPPAPSLEVAKNVL